MVLCLYFGQKMIVPLKTYKRDLQNVGQYGQILFCLKGDIYGVIKSGSNFSLAHNLSYLSYLICGFVSIFWANDENDTLNLQKGFPKCGSI